MIKLFKEGLCESSGIKRDSVQLILVNPSLFNLNPYYREVDFKDQYKDFLNRLQEVLSPSITALQQGCRLCINIEPMFVSGRTKARLVLDDIIHYLERTGVMEYQSLFILDNRKMNGPWRGLACNSKHEVSSSGSLPYPNNIYSSYPYQWIVVFHKKGNRLNVDRDIMEKSKLTEDEWNKWVRDPIWELPEPEEYDIYEHSTPYHIELPFRLMKLYSFVGDVVLDPLTETGITALAAKKLGRKFIGYNCFDIKEIRKRLAKQI